MVFKWPFQSSLSPHTIKYFIRFMGAHKRGYFYHVAIIGCSFVRWATNAQCFKSIMISETFNWILSFNKLQTLGKTKNFIFISKSSIYLVESEVIKNHLIFFLECKIYVYLMNGNCFFFNNSVFEVISKYILD